MKKRILSLLLALVMTASMLPVFSVAAAGSDYEPTEVSSDYFYNQLNDRAKAIYKKLLDEFTNTATKEKYYEGTQPIDLIGVNYLDGSAKSGPIITENDIKEYAKGNKDIFNDFCAAKDALDLDHSELWYIDSGYLTFRVTHGSVEAEYGDGYHVLIGPGRGDTYLLGGLTADKIALNGETIKTMDEKINATINNMVSKAVSALNTANAEGTYSKPDQLAFLATNIHDQITMGIHYRYEIECTYPEDAKFIRTVYGMQTHEGVCEAYARTLQVCLTRLGIESVLIHGVQTKGTPEDHMWNAVNIPNTDAQETPRWYVIDATWDDPLTATYTGERDLSFHYGEDGKETNTYLLVGQSLVGEHWRPSGYVSTGNFEFKYPTIETAAYSGATILGDDNGLKIDYSTGGSEEGVPAGVFSVTYRGMDAQTARQKGLYFMVKMYDYHTDGTADVMDEWYYADASFAATGSNPYFGDNGGALRIYTPTCEYVEIAVTTREPDHRDTWELDPSSGGNYLTQSKGEAGYFHGDESEIIAQSGLLYNVNSKYEAPPYVLTQFPAPNGNCTAGYDYRFKVTYDDLLYHILPADVNAESGIDAIDAFQDDSAAALSKTVRVRYTTIQQDLHTGGEKYVQIAGELPFDVNRDGYVDMPGVDDTVNPYVNFKWIYATDAIADGGEGLDKCPNTAYHANHNECSVTDGCPIVGVEFNFRASDQWIDDITEYNFAIEGVVGSRSSKVPNNFSVISCIPGLCPACYRSQGIDWNLWGQPTLLDAPENLDLEAMAKSGGTDAETLEQLNSEMNRSDLNGRLMLVVEDKSKGAGNREDYEKIEDALSKDSEYQGQVAGGEVVGSSVFEINFNRICPMVKLKPNQGQSLRVQVGYPAGITYETLKDYDLQAYHFTRCAEENESMYPCSHASEEGHKWGDHIVGVDKITIVPTPYGMVIMCDAFSPFEIVAVKKTAEAAAIAAAETGSTLVVVSDGNGYVEVGGKKAVGEDGNVTFASGEQKTFKVVANEGYSVDTVSLGGEKLTVDGNGEFTVTEGSDYFAHSDVLSVTFLPTEVKTEEVREYGETVVASVCTHPTLIPDENDTTEESEASCTTPGYKKAQVCSDCGQTVVPATVIPATGHTFDAQTKDRKDVTCTNGVEIPEVRCKTCHAVVSEAISIPPLGHDFENYEDQGEATCQGQPMVGKCTRCGASSSPVMNKEAAVAHSFTANKTVVSPATCEANERIQYRCQWCDQTTEEEVAGTIKEHTDNGSGFCTYCGKKLCDINGGHKWEEIAKVEPTCEEPGRTAYKKCSVCGEIEGTIETIPALNHDFGGGHTAGTKCSRCDKTLQSDQHTWEDMPSRAATCDEPGSEGGSWCSQCHFINEQPKEVPALGHSWDADSAEIKWAEGGIPAANVTFTCKNDHEHTITVPATVTPIGEVTCDATSVEYKASVTVPGTHIVKEDFETQTLAAAASEHKFDEEHVKITEATCTKPETREYTCTVCGQTKFETVGDPLPHNVTDLKEGTKLATCTEPGTLVGICSLCHEQVEETVAALGHDYVNGICTRCGATNTSYTAPPSVPTSKTETVTAADGTKTTTVTDPDGSKTTTVTTTDGVVGTTKTDADGSITSVEVTMSSAPEDGSAVVAPVEVKASASSEDAPEIGITVREGSARVEIPVEDVSHGTVAVVVDKDGNETVVRDCAVDENGVIITVDGSVTVKIVDRSVDFTDVQTTGHWASDAVEFVVARDLFRGTGTGVFSPETAMERGMLVTVLHRLAYEPEAVSTEMTFGDIQSSDYFAEASAWANANGIVEGYNGSFRPHDDVSREDLVTILYRYAKFKGYATETDGNALASFTDVQEIKGYAVDAMNWAVSVGLVNGVSAGKLAPQSGAKRAEVAAIIERFCENVVK